MEDYDTLLNTTRNLEQQYIKDKIEKYSNQVVSLLQEIEQYKEANENLRMQEDSLREELELCKVRNGELEKLLKEGNGKGKKKNDDSRIRELEKELAEQKKLSTANEKRILNENEEIINELKTALENSKETGTKGKKEGNELKDLQKEILKTLRQHAAATEARILKIESAIQGTKLQGSSSFAEATKKFKDEIEALKIENDILKSNEKKGKEQCDSIVLLRDSIESKNRTIEVQKEQIQKLNEKLNKTKEFAISNPFDENAAKTADPWALDLPKAEPVGKKNKVAKKEASKKADKPVNVENIIRKDNNDFFNNLSFNNSSPIVERKKNFK